MVQKKVQVKGPKFDGMLDRFWSILGCPFGSKCGPKTVIKRIPSQGSKTKGQEEAKKVATPDEEGSGKARGNPEEGSRKAQGSREEGSWANQGPPREKIIRIKDQVKDLTRWARPGKL